MDASLSQVVSLTGLRPTQLESFGTVIGKVVLATTTARVGISSDQTGGFLGSISPEIGSALSAGETV